MRLRSAGCCNCNGSACGLECRAKSAVGTLCGFEEFVVSDPPRFYRRRQVTGDAKTCTHLVPDCVLPECKSYAHIAGGGDIAGVPGKINSVGHFSIVSIVGEMALYEANCGTIMSGDPDPGPLDTRLVVTTVAHGTTALVHTQQAWFHLGDIATVYLQFSYVYWINVGSACCLIGAPRIGVEMDHWAEDQHWSAETCTLTATSASAHKAGATDSCDDPGGTETAISCELDVCYGTPTSENATERHWDVLTCFPFEAGSMSVERAVAEVLSEEDTPADAIARAVVAETWVEGDCVSNTAFITPREGRDVAFRQVEVRGVCGTAELPLILGHLYEAKIRFYRREVGTGGAFIYHAQVIVSFTADLTIDRTDWLAVPNEEGWETRAGSCALTDLSA